MTSSSPNFDSPTPFDGLSDNIEEIVRNQRVRLILSQDELLRDYRGPREQLAIFIGSLLTRAQLPEDEEPIADAEHDTRFGVEVDDQALSMLMPDVALHLSAGDVDALVAKTRILLDDPNV
jgi:hypothetical protein